MQFQRLRTACLVAVALVASGCGGGGDSSKSSAASAPPASGNVAPTIQGQPGSTVVVGQTYSFQPSASDSNGDRLTFTAANLPAWASLNADTGRLSGTPTSAQLGTYSGITITVSDGTTSASLAPFAITVTDVANGSATLSWVPPTQNDDGSVLTNLAGYRVLYGQSANDLAQTVTLNNPSINRFVIENLGAGTWYFAVVSVNGAGVISLPTNIATKTIS